MNTRKPNRRRHPRVTLPDHYHLRCASDRFRGRIRVLGEGGMFIDTIHPPPDGTEVDVIIEAGDTIHVRCISRDHESGWGVGVEFLQVAPDDRDRLRDLISRFV